MATIPWTQYTEAVVGHNHPTLTDTDNRPLRQVLTDMGLNPDGDPDPLLLALHFGPHGDTNYNNGDATPGGQLRVYSQIAGYGTGTGVGDLVLMCAKSRSGGFDADIHLVPETVGGVRGLGQVFIDTDIKVADFITSPARGHGLRILQTDNSTSMEFPISGGRILVPGVLEGTNGAGDLVGRISTAGRFFNIVDHTGSALFSVSDSSGNVSTTGAFVGLGVTITGGRFVSSVIPLTWAASVAIPANQGNQFRLAATSNIAATIQVPSVNPSGAFTQDIEIEIVNSSGGALTTPVAFAGGGGGFTTTGGVSPANGLEIVVRFCWNSTRNTWIETGRSTAL